MYLRQKATLIFTNEHNIIQYLTLYHKFVNFLWHGNFITRSGAWLFFNHTFAISNQSITHVNKNIFHTYLFTWFYLYQKASHLLQSLLPHYHYKFNVDLIYMTFVIYVDSNSKLLFCHRHSLMKMQIFVEMYLVFISTFWWKIISQTNYVCKFKPQNTNITFSLQ